MTTVGNLELYAFDKYIGKGSAFSTLCGVAVGNSQRWNQGAKDATNLQKIEGTSFDIVVFSFNGIDSICSEQGRLISLREIYRVLRPGGYFIFLRATLCDLESGAFRPC